MSKDTEPVQGEIDMTGLNIMQSFNGETEQIVVARIRVMLKGRTLRGSDGGVTVEGTFYDVVFKGGVCTVQIHAGETNNSDSLSSNQTFAEFTLSKIAVLR